MILKIKTLNTFRMLQIFNVLCFLKTFILHFTKKSLIIFIISQLLYLMFNLLFTKLSLRLAGHYEGSVGASTRK